MSKLLSTVWGESLDKNNVLPEYPRPYMERDSYINLNGFWDCTITGNTTIPVSFDKKILVPFSPETPLSGVGHVLMPDEYLWYRRAFVVNSAQASGNKRLLLHFGAVDQMALVYINGTPAGKHVGGYLPFTLDISELITEGENTLIVMVRDVTDSSFHSRGKQKLKHGGMFYTPQSGIWQTVWLEEVPERYITDIRLTPLYDSSEVEIELYINEASDINTEDAPPQSGTSEFETTVTVYDGDEVTGRYTFQKNERIKLWLPGFKSWTPENPFLYTYTLTTGDDCIRGYFAMRKFSTGHDRNGIPRLFLNNKPYFHNGLLDQGYWPDGLYTAPTDEALAYDIIKAKEMGFNMLRKHAKLEPLRWYYHCDRLGMLVWQDIVNGGSDYKSWFVTYFPNVLSKQAEKIKDNNYKLLSRESAAGRKEYLRELTATVNYLYNIPSVAVWVLFNEGWGQFDALDAVKKLEALDKTRTVDHASGWFDQGGGDIKSLHIYFSAFNFKPEKRVLALSEFGGYAYGVPGHTCCDKIYGYRKYGTTAEFTAAYKKLYIEKIIPGIKNGLSAAVYTQVSDIEDEINGLLTYDRKILKIDAATVHKINIQLCYDAE